jgi:hypothetical protein
MRPGLKGWVVVACVTAAIGSADAANSPQNTAVLQALDKVTARISTLDAPIGQMVRFGTLEIRARYCSKTPPEEAPESVAFLEIDEVRRDELPTRRFSGWMYASSPAVSALEHPVYDVWVVDCKNVSISRSPTSR